MTGSVFGMSLEQAKAKIKVGALIEKYSMKNNVDRDPKNILIFIMRKKEIEINEHLVRAFIARGIDINQVDNSGWNALAAAVWCGRADVLYTLIRCGIDIEQAFQKLIVAQSSADDDSVTTPMVHCGAFYLDLSRKPLLMSYLLSLQRLNIHFPPEIHARILSYCPEIIPSRYLHALYPAKERDRIWKLHQDEVVELYKECRKWPKK